MALKTFEFAANPMREQIGYELAFTLPDDNKNIVSTKILSLANKLQSNELSTLTITFLIQDTDIFGNIKEGEFIYPRIELDNKFQISRRYAGTFEDILIRATAKEWNLNDVKLNFARIQTQEQRVASSSNGQ